MRSIAILAGASGILTAPALFSMPAIAQEPVSAGAGFPACQSQQVIDFSGAGEGFPNSLRSAAMPDKWWVRCWSGPLGADRIRPLV